MLKSIPSAALAALFVTSMASGPAFAQTPSSVPYINLVELVIVPSDLPKFFELARAHAAATAKGPGVREFDISQLASNPNHVFFYEVYDNKAAYDTHMTTDEVQKFRASIDAMVADRNVHALSVVEFHAKNH